MDDLIIALVVNQLGGGSEEIGAFLLFVILIVIALVAFSINLGQTKRFTAAGIGWSIVIAIVVQAVSCFAISQ